MIRIRLVAAAVLLATGPLLLSTRAGAQTPPAANPPAQAAATAPGGQSSTAVPTAAPTAAPPSAATTDADATKAAQAARARLLDEAAASGFHLKVRSGTNYYCRVTTPLGSHIPESECLTEAALRSRLTAEADNRDEWAKSRRCGNMACAGMTPQGH